MKKKNYSAPILFVLLLVVAIVFWFIIGPSSLQLEGVSGLGSLIHGIALYLIPPVAAILTFNRKIPAAIIIAIIFIVLVLIYQIVRIGNEELIVTTMLWLILWDSIAILIAGALRFALDKINQFEKME